jgi:acyl-CoA dehydrogenase
MAWEASRPDVDARRALLSRLVLDHRLSAQDPLAPASFDWEGEASRLIFADRKIEMPEIVHLLA